MPTVRQIEEYVHDEAMACQGCDVLVYLPELAIGQRAQCPRCGCVLAARHKDAFSRLLSFSLSAIIFLVFANLFGFLSLNVRGQEQAITLMESITLLVESGEALLAVAIVLTIIVIPAIFLVGVFLTLWAIKRAAITSLYLRLFRLVLLIHTWAMAEIFIVGVLISLIKIVSLADVSLGLSFWAYILFSVFMTATLLHFDKVQIWHWVEQGASNAGRA